MGLQRRSRLVDLQNAMQRLGIDLAVVMQPRDVYYYTGTAQPCNLVVPSTGMPVLFVRRAMEFVRAESFLPSEQILSGAGIGDIREFISKLDFPVRTVGLTLDAVPAAIYLKLQQCAEDALVVNLSPIILEQRLCKDEGELEAIRRAAGLFADVHETMMNHLRPGISEIELSAQVLASVRRHEGESIIRNRRWDCSLPPDGLVVSSPNMWRISGHAMTVTGVGLSPALAWGASQSVIKRGDLVMVDIGLNLYGYHADIARTYVVGRADSEQKEVFQQVKEIQDAVISKIKPGVLVNELFESALAKAEELKVAHYFQGYGTMQGSYVGHGLGLELDEPPTIAPGSEMELRAGMVLAIEPKLIIPQWGAIDLEDDVIVTENGCELISPVPRELFEVL